MSNELQKLGDRLGPTIQETQLARLIQTTWATFVDFWTNREPWQDYDVCIIPVEGAWCVAISHNDRVHVVGDRFLPNSSFGAFGHAYRLK